MGKWEAHFERIQKNDSLTSNEKAEILHGLKALREIFDDAWLWENAGKGFTHPLMNYLGNYAPISLQWLASFGIKLHIIKDVVGFKEIVSRLRNAQEYRGAEAEVETVGKLAIANIKDIQLYPKVMVNGKLKKSDIKVTLDDIDFYFEVTTLGDSEASVKANETFQELDFLFAPEINRFCQVYD